ncbi:MAG: hypothetical protein AAF871_14285 [Pseudomonadota bacterium]
MAFSATLVGSAISFAAYVVLTVTTQVPLAQTFGISLMAGQFVFAALIVKGMVCRALQQTGRSGRGPEARQPPRAFL